jgi:hypothetical protein
MERDQWPEVDLLFTEFSEWVNAYYTLHKGDSAEAFVREVSWSYFKEQYESIKENKAVPPTLDTEAFYSALKEPEFRSRFMAHSKSNADVMKVIRTLADEDDR